MLLSAIEDALAEAGLARRGAGRVLVACSGGADSTALGEAAVRLLGPDRVVFGHVDHAVQPDSAAVAARVAAFALSLGAAPLCRRLPPGSAAEARLREERYAALEAMRVEAAAQLILTAHTADDQAETMLLQLIRSTHAGALAGMPKRRGVILRPWLEQPRRAVRSYAKRRGLPVEEDPSNLEVAYLRNRIRKELLPLIELRYRPGFSLRMARLSERITAPPAAPRPAPAPQPPPARAWPSVQLLRRARGAEPPPDGTLEAHFDAAQLIAPILRPLRPGDRIQPFGMRGRRKVRDLLREAGVPAAAREDFPVLVDGARGAVIWVPGVRRSAFAPVLGRTTELWVFRVLSSNEGAPFSGA